MFILADDLTGAMDAAAPFHQNGASATVCWSADKAGDAEVVAVNTNSRGLAPDAAARIVAQQIALWNARPDRGLLFKKIDSTLRGNTIVEVMAAFAAGQFRTLVFCPALPGEGRVVRDGVLSVHGRSLAEWSGQSGQAAPSRIDAHFDASGPAQIVNLRPGDAVPQTGSPQILIYDARTDADLDQIANAATGIIAPLLAGSSGLAAAVARKRPRSREPSAPLPAAKRVLFVIGSRSAESRAQIDALRRALPAANILAAARKPGSDAALIEQELAEQTALHIRSAAPDTLFLSGGATAEAVLHHLQTRSISLCPPPLPGIAAGICTTRFGPMRLWTKAGAFGKPDLLVRLTETLHGPL